LPRLVYQASCNLSHAKNSLIELRYFIVVLGVGGDMSDFGEHQILLSALNAVLLF